MGNEMSENGVGPTPIPYDRGREVTEDMIAGRGRGENAGAARGGYGGAGVGRGPVPGHGRGGGGGGGGGNQMGGNVVSGRGGPGAGVGRGGRGGTIGRGGGDSMGRWVGPTVGGSTVAVPTPPPPASAGPAFVIPGRGRGRGETRAHAPQPPHGRGGGASSRSGDAGSRTKPAPWAAPAPGNVMEDDGPPEADLSHLTEEERAHILAVLSRAKDLQDKDEERVRILEDEFTKYTKDIKRRASDASSTADGASKNLCPVCNRTELDESAIPGSAQEGLECQDCERPVCLQCGFYTPSIASQSRERRKKLERGASFSANEDGRKPRSTLHRGLSEQHSAPVGGLQHHPLTEVCSSSSGSLDPHSQQQQSPEGSSPLKSHGGNGLQSSVSSIESGRSSPQKGSQSQRNGARSSPSSAESAHSSPIPSGSSVVVSQPTEGFQVQRSTGDDSKSASKPSPGSHSQRLQDSVTKGPTKGTSVSQRSLVKDVANSDGIRDSASREPRVQERTSIQYLNRQEDDSKNSQQFQPIETAEKEKYTLTDSSKPDTPASQSKPSTQNPRGMETQGGREVPRKTGEVQRKMGSVQQPDIDVAFSLSHGSQINSSIASQVASKRSEVTARDQSADIGFTPVATTKDSSDRTKGNPHSAPRKPSADDLDERSSKTSGNIRVHESKYSSPSRKEIIMAHEEGSIDDEEMMRQLLAMAEQASPERKLFPSIREHDDNPARLPGVDKVDKSPSHRPEEEQNSKIHRPILTLTADRGSPVAAFVLTSAKESPVSGDMAEKMFEHVSMKTEEHIESQHYATSTRKDEIDYTLHNPHHIEADSMAESIAVEKEERNIGPAVSQMERLKRGKSEERPPRQGSLDDSHFNLRRRPDITPTDYESLSDSEIKADQSRRVRKTLLGDRPKQVSEDLSDLPGLTDLGAIGGDNLNDIPPLWPPASEGAESKYISVEDLTKVGLGGRVPVIGQKHANSNSRRKRQKSSDTPLSPIYDVEGESPTVDLAFDQLSSECTSLADDSEDEINREYYEDQDYMTEDRSYSSFDSGDDYTDYMEDVIMEDIGIEHEVVEHLSPYRIKEEGLATVMEEQEEVDDYYIEEEEEEELEEDDDEVEEYESREERERDRVNILTTIQEQTSEDTQESPDYMSPSDDRYTASGKSEQRLSRKDQHLQDASASDDTSDLSTDQTFESLSSALTREHIAPVAATVEKEFSQQSSARPPLDIDLTSNQKLDNIGVLESPRTPTKDARSYERPRITSPNKRFDISSPRTSPISPSLKFSPPLTPKQWMSKRTFPETMFPMEHSQVEADPDDGAEGPTKYRSVLTEMGSSFEEFANISWPDSISEDPSPPSAKSSSKERLYLEVGSSISPEDSTSASESTVIACGQMVSSSAQTHSVVESRTQTTPPPVSKPPLPPSKILIDAAVGPGAESPDSNSTSPTKSVHTTSIGVGTSPELSPTSSIHSTDTDFSVAGSKRHLYFDETKQMVASTNASSSGSSSPEPTGSTKRNPRPSRMDAASQSTNMDSLASLKFTGKDYLKASSSDAESCDSESSTPAKVRRRLPVVPKNVQPVTVSIKSDLGSTIDEILRDSEKSVDVQKVKELLARKTAELEKERREALLKLRKLASDTKRIEEGKERLSRRYNRHHKARVAGVTEGSLSDSDVTITSEDRETEELAALLHPMYGMHNPFPTGKLSISSDRIHEIETSDLPSGIIVSPGDQIRLSKSEEDIIREIEKQISEATGKDYKAYNTSHIEKEVRSRYSDSQEDSRKNKKDTRRKTPLQEKFTTSEIPDYGLKTVRHKMKEELKQVTAHRRAQLDNSPPHHIQSSQDPQVIILSPDRHEGEQREEPNGGKSSGSAKAGKSGGSLPVRASPQASPQRRKARWQPTDSVAPAFSPIKEDVDSEFDFHPQTISDHRSNGMSDKRSHSYDSSVKSKKSSSGHTKSRESPPVTSDDVERLSKEGELIEKRIREQTERQFRQELDRRRRQMEESARKLEEMKTRRQTDWSASTSTTSEPVISASHSLETLKAAYEADNSPKDPLRYDGQEPVTYPRTKLKRGSPFHYSSPQLTDRERGIRRDQQGLILPITDGQGGGGGGGGASGGAGGAGGSGGGDSMSDSGMPSRQGSINRGERIGRPRMMSRESSLDSTNSEMRLFSDQDENVLYDDTITPEKAVDYRRPEPPPRHQSSHQPPHHHHPHHQEQRRGTDEEWDSSESGPPPPPPLMPRAHGGSSRQGRGQEGIQGSQPKRHPEDYYYSDQEIRVKATEWSRRAEDSDDNEVDRRLRAQYHDDHFHFHGAQYQRGTEPSPQSVGRKYRLLRDPRDRTNRGNGLGMRVVGGKRMPGNDQLVAYVAEIYPGGIADRTEGLREGDQVLEWCGISLTGRTYEEVQRIVKSSEKQTEVLLKCGPNLLDSPRPRARLANGGPPPPPPPPPGGYRRGDYGGGVDPRMLSERLEGITYPSYQSSASPSESTHSSHQGRGRGRKITGEIQLQVAYDSHRAELLVGILRGRGLTARDSTNLADPYVSVCLLPARGPEDRQRSRYVPRTLTPEWNQSIIFRNLRHSQIRSRTIEVNVWDYDRSSTSEFMGQVILDLSDERLLTNRPRWYRLLDVPSHGGQHPPHSSVMSPPTSSPGSRQGSRRSHHDQRSSEGRGDSRPRKSSGERDPRSGSGGHVGGRTGSRGAGGNGDRGSGGTGNGVMYDRPSRYSSHHHHHHPDSDSPSSRSSGYEYDTDRSSQSDRSISSTQEHHRNKKFDPSPPQQRTHVHFSRTHENDRYKRDMNSLPETIPEAPSVETTPPTTTVSTSVKITVTAKPMCSLAGQRTSSLQSVVNGNGRVIESLSETNGVGTKTTFEHRPVIRVEDCAGSKPELVRERQAGSGRAPEISIFNYTSTDPASRAQGSQSTKEQPTTSHHRDPVIQRETLAPRQTNSLKLTPSKNGLASSQYRSTGSLEMQRPRQSTCNRRSESVAELGITEVPEMNEKNLQNHKISSDDDRYSPWIEKQKVQPHTQSLIDSAQELPLKSQMKATLVTRLARGDLGPGQVVDPEMPRQVDLILLRGEYEIAGEIKIGFRRENKADGENLYVQVFQCRKIRHRGKPMDHPDLYVKAYVVMGERKISKKKTRICRQEKDPTFNEVFVYHTGVKGVAIEMSLWAAGGRFGRNTLIGEALIWLDDLKLEQSEIVGWYKLLLSTSAPS